MLNEWLLVLAQFFAAQEWSVALHESIYAYAWIETVHVLTLTLFLGMLVIIDLRMLGWAFGGFPATELARRLSQPMLIGFVVMVITGFILYYAIPIRTTQSIWFRIKVVLLVVAGINAWLFHRALRNAESSWNDRGLPPPRLRTGAGLSLILWSGVVFAGRAIAYDWFDCHKPLSGMMFWAAGCVQELAAFEATEH
jgi:uncharacterized membrane protein